jgi:hypothetical protein
MLKELLERLRHVALLDDMDVKTYAEKVQERQNLREELEKERDARESELEEIADAMDGLDYADATEADDGTGDNNGETQ